MITKTNYVDYIGCPRAYYYYVNNNDQAKETDESAKKRIDEGKLINNYAHLYFPNTVLVKPNQDIVDTNIQVELTKKLLDSDAIAEASFIYKDLFCAVDILVNNKDGSYDIYEVKACNNIDKQHLRKYYPDVAFQRYVLINNGIKVRKCFILHLNKEYIRQGQIDVKQLLVPFELTNDKEFINHCNNVETRLTMMRKLISDKTLPKYGNCSKNCPFYQFCHSDLPRNNVLKINNIRSSKAHSYIENGIITFEDLIRVGNFKLSEMQKAQIKVCLHPELNPYINKPLLKKFLNELKYPIYHLDFETMEEAIPPFNGTHSYQQIPFQYSLHIEYEQGGKCDHKEFLADKIDAEYELAKQLCEDIPLNVTSMAFHASTEKGICEYLAKKFPQFSDHLMNIANNMIDLLEPFKKGHYYDIKQDGSNSIKYVMPALAPEMAEAYHNLPIVHNGGEALAMFPKMLKMGGKQREKVRKGMLEYCKLDTLSMVKVLNRLWKETK